MPRTALSPKKLLHSKWTAAVPQQREKHFVVTRVLEPAVEGGPIEQIELEAVHSRRTRLLHWRELTDPGQWLCGWL